jgi:tRNA modification GTPase
VVDEGLAVLMRRPRSFTGEDVLELQCHGSPMALRRVLSCVLSCGARLAEPGEFTKRAFLNGRLDLAQAEAIIDMVHARTRAAAARAAEQLCGQLSDYVADLRSQLVCLKALLEAQIDFSEEDFEVSSGELLGAAAQCMVRITTLVDTYRHGKIMRDGLRVAIVGKPNVGKSSLLNALLGEDRAIVTAIAGTTRDAIDETADFEGVPVVLSDTAGLRHEELADTVERLGMQRTASRIAESQVVVTVLDASQPLNAEDYAVLRMPAAAPRVIALNKIDLPKAMAEADICNLANGIPVVAVSAMERIGLADLRRTVLEQVIGRASTENGPVLTNLRHVDALSKALESLRLARESITNHRPPDLVAVDVQDAIDHIGEVTGAITNDDVLDRVFSEFCIGK